MQYLSAAVGGSLESVTSVTEFTKWSQLDRFLILGSENGIYHTGRRKLTPEQASGLRACLEEDGLRVVSAISGAAGSGRVPKVDPLLLALAMAASPVYADPRTNAAALDALISVARHASHIQKFAAYVTRLRGWGRSLRSGIARWYLQQSPRELAQQMLKTRMRGRWSHADLLRLAHPKPPTKAQSLLFRWVVEGELGRMSDELQNTDLKQIYAFEQAKQATERREVIRLIEDYQLTYEMIPDQWLDSAEVWEALLDTMPYCALLRHLGKLTAIGLITPQGEATALVAARLVDRGRIARAKANPAAPLSALLKYRLDKGVPAILAALEEAYYISFESIQPTGRQICVVADGAAPMAGAVMTMIAARTETGAVVSPAVGKRDRLDTVLARLSGPLQLDASADADAIVFVTGDGHGLPSLHRYPDHCRLVAIAANAAEAPLPDRDDPRLLQVVGFDTTVPAVVADFIRTY